MGVATWLVKIGSRELNGQLDPGIDGRFDERVKVS